jgi:hypothetical protein
LGGDAKVGFAAFDEAPLAEAAEHGLIENVAFLNPDEEISVIPRAHLYLGDPAVELHDEGLACFGDGGWIEVSKRCSVADARRPVLIERLGADLILLGKVEGRETLMGAGVEVLSDVGGGEIIVGLLEFDALVLPARDELVKSGGGRK